MPNDVYTVLAGAGVAGIWLLCLMMGFMYTKSHVDDLKEQNRELKEALSLANERAENERRRADAAVEAAQTSNLLLAGIRRGIPNAT